MIRCKKDNGNNYCSIAVVFLDLIKNFFKNIKKFIFLYKPKINSMYLNICNQKNGRKNS